MHTSICEAWNQASASCDCVADCGIMDCFQPRRKPILPDFQGWCPHSFWTCKNIAWFGVCVLAWLFVLGTWIAQQENVNNSPNQTIAVSEYCRVGSLSIFLNGRSGDQCFLEETLLDRGRTEIPNIHCRLRPPSGSQCAWPEVKQKL